MTTTRSAIILMGPPAGGKTTVSDAIASNDAVAIIRTGHLLRNAVKANTNLGRELKAYLESGQLAPTKLVVGLIGEAIDQTQARVLVFDGFPRLEDQIDPFFHMLEQRGIDLAAVLVLTLSDQEIMQRLTGRRACPACGATYHVQAQPPSRENQCDECGGPLIQRHDDTPEAITARLNVYQKETFPVVAFFQSAHPALVNEVSVEESTRAACAVLRDLVHRAGSAA